MFDWYWNNVNVLFKCNVDLVRFRSTLRPLFKSNIQNDVIYVQWGIENIISHEYANIDEAIIVSTINDDLPMLKTVIEKLLTKFSPPIPNP